MIKLSFGNEESHLKHGDENPHEPNVVVEQMTTQARVEAETMVDSPNG